MLHPEKNLNRSFREYISSQVVDDKAVYLSKRRIYKTLWYEHFFNVFNLLNTNSEETINNIVVDVQPNQIVNKYNQGVLNCIITHEEICTSIKKLSRLAKTS